MAFQNKETVNLKTDSNKEYELNKMNTNGTNSILSLAVIFFHMT